MTTVKQVRDYMEEIKDFVKENKDHMDERVYNKDILNKFEIGFDMIEGIPSPSMREKVGNDLYALIGFC